MKTTLNRIYSGTNEMNEKATVAVETVIDEKRTSFVVTLIDPISEQSQKRTFSNYTKAHQHFRFLVSALQKDGF